MIRGLCILPLRAADKREIVVCVSSILVASERLQEMVRGLLVFAAAIVGEAQRGVRGGETRIPSQSPFISLARLTLPALSVEGQALDISLLGAGRNFRVGHRSSRRFEIEVGVNRHVGAV